MDYEIEKLHNEYMEMLSLWKKLKMTWNNDLSTEDLYRLYPFLTTTSALARKYTQWNNKNDFLVNIIRPSFSRDVDVSQYFYSGEIAFLKGFEETRPLSFVAGIFLHQEQYGYMDNRLADGKISKGTRIFVYAKTDRVCDNCKPVNENPRRSRVSFSDCTCGYYIDIDSYLIAIKRIIDTERKLL